MRVAAGAEVGQLSVNGWITTYLARYPEVSVVADFSNRVSDIVHEGIDVAIRVRALADSEPGARRLGAIAYGLYASDDYLASRGCPETLADLAGHALVHFSPYGLSRRELTNGAVARHPAITPRLVVNNNLAAREAVAAGLGIALLPVFQAELPDLPPLRRILPAWSRRPVPVHAVFTSTRYMTPKVRAFVDICRESF